MLKQRVLVAVVLLPIGITAIMYGGIAFTALMAIFMGLAAWEYAGLFKTGGYQPSGFMVVAGVLALVISRSLFGFDYDPPLLAAVVLLSTTIHVISYERGRDKAGSDFAATAGGIFYLGILGSYFVLLRNLPEGQWWVLTVLPAIWLADSGAYFIGSKWGVNKMAPRLSPKKSWQGYFGGILAAVIGTPLLVMSYSLDPNSEITLMRAAIIGLVMGIFPTLGDLAESMFKRQVGVKDSGTILPGHGGIFDRIDSWLWGAAIGYYLIVWFFLAR